MEKLLKVSSSPHVRDGVTTQRLMFDVVIAMIPASVYGVWQFGMNAPGSDRYRDRQCGSRVSL